MKSARGGELRRCGGGSGRETASFEAFWEGEAQKEFGDLGPAEEAKGPAATAVAIAAAPVAVAAAVVRVAAAAAADPAAERS